LKNAPWITAGPARPGWLSGLSRALPIVLGYLPIGVAFGILAQKAGISPANTLLMSVLVYAGSSQLIAVGLLEAGVSGLSVILTTLVVNLRHLLMSAALSPYLRKWRKVELAAFAFELTDETFAVHSTRFAYAGANKAETFATNAVLQTVWVLATWLGIVIGQLIVHTQPLALDYALPAMFIALLVLQIKDRTQVGVAIFAGLLAVVLLRAGIERWNVILATVVGATLGLWVTQWTNKSSS